MVTQTHAQETVRKGYISVMGFLVYAGCGRCGSTASYIAPMMTGASDDMKRTWKHTEKHGWVCPYCARKKGKNGEN